MKQRTLAIVIALYLIVLLGGCADRSGKDVLARIDKKYTITRKDFNDRISKLPERYQDAINKNKKAFLDELVVDILLYNEAIAQKLENDPDVKEVMKEAKKKILIARLLKDEVEDKVKVSEEEIENYYNANKEDFTMPEVLRASHILVKTEKEAKDILSELSKNGNFEDLARSHSVDPTSKIGGDIGYFTRNQLVPEIEEVCYDMKVGEISGVVKTRFGYHVIMLTERKEPRIKELPEVHDAIEQILARLKKRTVFNEYVTDLKEESQITINSNLLESMSEEKNPEEQTGD